MIESLEPRILYQSDGVPPQPTRGNEGKIFPSELDQLPDDLRRVVEELTSEIPANSWAIEQTARTRTSRFSPFFSVEDELRVSPNVVQKLLGGDIHGSLRIVPSKTMAIGLYPGGRRTEEAIRLGLFSLPEKSRYDPNAVKKALGGQPSDVVLHNRVDVVRIAGRVHGAVSLILAEQHLRNFSVVEISSTLTEEIQRPHSAVAYPLGGKDLLYFCARGPEFLQAYGNLLSKMNIRANFGITTAA